MPRMNVYFPTETDKSNLRLMAKRLGVSPSEVVRMALRKFYDKMKHEEKVRKHG